MRRSVAGVAFAALLGLSLTPSAAWAKGSTLRFERESYRPDDRAVALGLVETWRGSGQPEDGPYTVYLVQGRQPLWYGHLPADALPVSELVIGKERAGDTYPVTVTFVVPDVSDGLYSVWVCRKQCGANSGFGDLVYGQLTLASNAEATARPESPPAEIRPASTQGTATSAWRPLGVATLLAVVSVMALLVMRRRQAPD